MIQRPKGTYDVYGSLAKKQDYVKRMFGAVCESYNFGYIETPKSHIIRCKQTDFIYSSKEALDRDWKFFAPTKEPYDFSFING